MPVTDRSEPVRRPHPSGLVPRCVVLLVLAAAGLLSVPASADPGDPAPSAAPDLAWLRDAPPEFSAAVRARLPRWHQLVPPEGRRWDFDVARRLVFTSTLDEDAHARLRAESARVVDAGAALLFRGPPDEPVLVAAVGGALARRLVGRGAHVGGRYVDSERFLAVREIGVSLRHELVHALHFADMRRRRLDQAHAFWIQEGLAALFETYDVDGAGGAAPAAAAPAPDAFGDNDRDALVVRLATRRRPSPIADFTTMPSGDFMKSALRHYAEARGLIRWMHDRGVLKTWYESIDDSGDPDGPDPGGSAAMAAALGIPASELDTAWRDWLRLQRPRPVTIESGGPWLGIDLVEAADPAGVRILRVSAGGPGRNAGLRARDIIRAVNGRPVPTEAELDRLIAQRSPDETVRLTVRRRDAEVEVSVLLGRYGVRPSRRGSSGLRPRRDSIDPPLELRVDAPPAAPYTPSGSVHSSRERSRYPDGEA